MKTIRFSYLLKALPRSFIFSDFFHTYLKENRYLYYCRYPVLEGGLALRRLITVMSAEKQPFETVYLDNHKYIYNLIFSRLCHRQTAEDLTSDVFLRALRNYDGFDPEKASPRTWLCRIASNAVIDYFRKKHDVLHENIDLAAEMSGGAHYDEYPVISGETSYELSRAISRLPEHDREIIRLSYYEGKKNQELADILGTSPKAVSERKRRAIKKLIKLYGRA